MRLLARPDPAGPGPRTAVAFGVGLSAAGGFAVGGGSWGPGLLLGALGAYCFFVALREAFLR